LNIYKLNMGGDNSKVDIDKHVNNILESLKSSIETKINDSYRYYHFMEQQKILEWKNKIIKLINKEIDQYKFNNLNNLNLKETPKYDKNKGNQTNQNTLNSQQEKIKNSIAKQKSPPTCKRIQGKADSKNINPIGSTYSRIQGRDDAKNINLNNSTKTQSQQGKNVEQKNFPHNSKIQNNNLNQRENKFDKLDFFTSKDIQEENKEITRIFQKESLNHINDDEEIENENIGHFLKEVALISRNAYNTSNELFKKMFKEFLNYKNEKKNISDLICEEKLKKEFSSWVKEYEKSPKGMQVYKNYFNSFTGQGIYNNNNYLYNLLSQLIKLYFHCELSFPIVEVNFQKEIKFVHEKMIDFINKGNNRKVDFVILPSLFSNGNFLENGKLWVFTYKNDTFKFGDPKFENLVNKQEKYSVTSSKSSLPKSQPNNMNNNSLRRESKNSNRINTSKELPKNSYYNNRENEKKVYKHKKIKNVNELIFNKK